jgi:AAA domain-containing protein
MKPRHEGPMDVKDFLTMEFPDVPSIVGNKLIIPGGLTLLAAAPKVGKSLLAIQLGFSRLYRRDWLGFPTSPGRTYYVNAEITERELQERLRTMLEQFDGEPLPKEALYLHTMLGRPLDVQENWDALVKGVKEYEPDLLVLDPLSKLVSGDDSKQEVVKPYLTRLERLRADTGVAVLQIHHTRKVNADKSEPDFDDISGTSVLRRDPDAIILAHSKDEGKHVQLKFSLRHAERPSPIKATRGENLWYAAPPAEIPARLVPNLLLLVTKPLTHTDWVTAIGGPRATATRRVKQCRERGYVDVVDGLYRLTELGASGLTVAEGPQLRVAA